MQQWLNRIPEKLLVGIILVAGVIFFFLANPPHTVCDSQIEVFKKSQTPFLFLDPKKNYLKTTAFEKSVETCKQGNSHGACRELFDGIEKVFIDLKTVPDECLGDVAGLAQIKQLLAGPIPVFARMAWGDYAPNEVHDRVGWFDTYHIRVICQMKKKIIEMYGQDMWSGLVNSTLPQLPQYNQLSREEGWARTIFSINCDSF